MAEAERRRISKDVVATGWTTDPDVWLDEAARAVLALVGDSDDGLDATEIRALVPSLAGKVSMSPGTKWGGEVPIAPRVLG